MTGKGIVKPLFLIGVVAALMALPAEGVETYSTSFEIPDYQIGPLPTNGWEVVGQGEAGIQADVVVEGTQALEIGPDTVVDKSLTQADGQPFTGNVLWIDAWTMVSPQSTMPDLQNIGEGSSLVHFNAEGGIVCLDGDGSGGGTWKETGFSVAQGQWVRVTIRQDYAAQMWDCYVNGQLSPEASGLGFKDTITSISGFKCASNPDAESYLDLFRVSTVPPAFVYPGGGLAGSSLFEFAGVWETQRPEIPYPTNQSETPFTVDPNMFFKYDFTLDDNISLEDLFYLIKHDLTVEKETNFQ